MGNGLLPLGAFSVHLSTVSPLRGQEEVGRHIHSEGQWLRKKAEAASETLDFSPARRSFGGSASGEKAKHLVPAFFMHSTRSISIFHQHHYEMGKQL